MIGQMAIAVAFPGFNDLGCTVTPVFLLMHHFLYQLSAFSQTILALVLAPFIGATVSNAS